MIDYCLGSEYFSRHGFQQRGEYFAGDAFKKKHGAVWQTEDPKG